VLAFRDGQALGVLNVTSTISETGPAIQASATVAATLNSVTNRSADLTLLIFEQTNVQGTSITFRLNSPDSGLGLNFQPFGPVLYRSAPKDIFTEFFKDIDALAAGTETERRESMRKLEQRGAWLYETLFPDVLRDVIWKLQDKIKSVLIQSDEPWIPWEMCRLVQKEEARYVDGPFLCEAFELTRWIPGIRRVDSLDMKNIGVVAPQDSGLNLAMDERDFLLRLDDQKRNVESIPANYLDVLDAMAKGSYDVIHFTGHGLFRDGDPNRSGIILENGNELRPTDISGRTRNLGMAHPLVFLNACQSGVGGWSLNDVGGWAAQFLRAGAGAFLGTYWSVYDDSAFNFARTFYQALFDGKTVAGSAREARASIKKDGKSTFLAYTVFAEPCARVKMEHK
jgi:hypothetical protein